MTAPRFRHAAINQGSAGPSQDRVAVRGGDGWLAVALADGAGGMGGGDLAADEVVRLLATADVASWQRSQGEVAAQSLDALDRRLATSAHGGQCTAVLLVAAADHVVGASVGDSAAWCSGADGDRVELTRGQRRRPLIGSGASRAVAFGARWSGHRVLVASDGLFQYAKAARIWEVASADDALDAVAGLVALVRLPGGSLQDDVSAALVSLTDCGSARSAAPAS